MEPDVLLLNNVHQSYKLFHSYLLGEWVKMCKKRAYEIPEGVFLGIDCHSEVIYCHNKLYGYCHSPQTALHTVNQDN